MLSSSYMFLAERRTPVNDTVPVGPVISGQTFFPETPILISASDLPTAFRRHVAGDCTTNGKNLSGCSGARERPSGYSTNLKGLDHNCSN